MGFRDMMNKISLTLIGGLALVLGLTGCSGNSDLVEYANQVEAKKVNKIPPIPQVQPYIAFPFSADGRRNPFLPELTKAEASSDVPPELQRPKAYMEQFPLDALRMVGVVKYGATVYAMILAPDQVIHRVTINEYLGQNYGKVVGISDEEIDLLETVPDGFNGWEHRPASLKMDNIAPPGKK